MQDSLAYKEPVKKNRNRSKGLPLLGDTTQKVEIFHILGPHSHPMRWLRWNFAQSIRPTCLLVVPSWYELVQRGKKPDFLACEEI